MSGEKRRRYTVTVTIAGEKHVLRSDAPPEYTRAVAAHVDDTMQAMGDAQPLQPHRTAILAALFITDELFRARKELEELREHLAARSGTLAERLEQAAAVDRRPPSHGSTEPDPPAASDPPRPSEPEPPAT
jgi:cell division protein ZapA (FtsZ GTPase activity inhibitor)